jgi:hypothetical protein
MMLALSTKTMADSKEIRPHGSVEAAKTAEEGSQIQPEPDPSRSRRGHEVKAQTGAASQGVGTSPKKKGRFDQKLPSRHTGGLHVPPAVPPDHDVGDVGWGNDGKVNNLASLSFGSGTECLAETYVVIDSEVDQNGSLTTKSLLQPGINKAVTSALDEQFVERTVLFLVFTRYFLARERSFKIMIKDLFKHKASQNNKIPLVFSADVPHLRHIAH